MANSPVPIEVPKTAVSMVSPRDYRLSSLCGYVVNFQADVPINVIPPVYLEALKMGARLVDEDAPLPTAPVMKPTIDPSIAEGAKLAAEANAGALIKALTVIITRNDPNDFKADNMPKLNKVLAEMAPEFSKPTATEVADAYAKLQENIDLAEE